MFGGHGFFYAWRYWTENASQLLLPGTGLWLNLMVLALCLGACYSPNKFCNHDLNLSDNSLSNSKYLLVIL